MTREEEQRTQEKCKVCKIAFAVCLLLQVGVVMLPSAASLFSVVPLGITQWLLVAVLCAALPAAVEISKAVRA